MGDAKAPSVSTLSAYNRCVDYRTAAPAVSPDVPILPDSEQTSYRAPSTPAWTQTTTCSNSPTGSRTARCCACPFWAAPPPSTCPPRWTSSPSARTSMAGSAARQVRAVEGGAAAGPLAGGKQRLLVSCVALAGQLVPEIPQLSRLQCLPCIARRPVPPAVTAQATSRMRARCLRALARCRWPTRCTWWTETCSAGGKTQGTGTVIDVRVTKSHCPKCSVL